MSGPSVIPLPMTLEAHHSKLAWLDGQQEQALCWTQGKVRSLEVEVSHLKAIVIDLTQRILDLEEGE